MYNNDHASALHHREEGRNSSQSLFFGASSSGDKMGTKTLDNTDNLVNLYNATKEIAGRRVIENGTCLNL